MIWIILAAAFFLRVYRVSDFLGFWFDQGRDALVIYNLWHQHHLFLIGPTTGIEGIFLGPFYYYLIAPLYFIGRGNPVVPAIFLAGLNTLTIYILYRFGKKYFGHWAGIVAASLYGFSFWLINYNRWLSNPTPLPLFSMLSVWWMADIVQKDRRSWIWPLLGLSLGLSLQLEAASATFFLPSVLIIFVIFRKNILSTWKKFSLLLGAFFATLLPQLIFNFRNQNILFNSFFKFLVSEKSFQTTVTNFYSQRLAFYFSAFTSKFILTDYSAWAFVIISGILFIFSFKFFPKKVISLLLIWWFTPLVCLLFYHGNNGYVWDYYFTGIYPVVCVVLGASYATFFSKYQNWRFVPLILLLVIYWQNLFQTYDYYFKKTEAPYISLTHITQAVDWVYTDAAGQKFNVDEYVPPMIPYAYEYVYKWRGEAVWKTLPEDQLVTRLYTLHEPDVEHQVLLNTWMTRQSRVGSIEITKIIGPLTVERRHRFDVNSK